MLCSGCGATYDDKAYNCPYCNKENERMTAVRQQQELGQIYSQVNDVVMEPVKRANKVTKKFAFIVIGLVALLVVITVVGIVLSGPLSMNSYEKQQANVAKLEAMMDEKDYAAIEKFMNKLGSAGYDYAYEKYMDVVDVIDDVRYCENEAQKVKLENRTKEQVVSSLNYDMYFLYVALRDIDRFEDSVYAKEEGEFIQENREKVYGIFKNTYKITEDEIEKWYDTDHSEVTNYKELSELSYSRLISN